MDSYTKYPNAVVQVTAATPFTDGASVEPLEKTVIARSNGFIISGGLIVCPASTVLIPASVLSGAKPLYRPVAIDGRIKNTYVPAAVVNVIINGMAGDLFTMNKKARVLGVAGYDDIAVLQIIESDQWNYGTGCIYGVEIVEDNTLCKLRSCAVPDLKAYPEHPYVHLLTNPCEADKYCPMKGQEACIPSCTATYSGKRFAFDGGPADVFEATVCKPVFIDGSGMYPSEGILVKSCLPATSCGGQPILDKDGCVMGMILGSYAGGMVYDDKSREGCLFFATNWKTLQYNVNAIIHAAKCQGDSSPKGVLNYCLKDQGYNLTVVRVPYLGLALDVFKGDYQLFTDYTSGASLDQSLIQDPPGSSDIGPGPTIKQVSGLTVLGMAGLNPDNVAGAIGGQWYVPGGLPANAPLPLGTASVQSNYCQCITITDDKFVEEIGISPVDIALVPGSILTDIGVKGSSDIYHLGQRSCESSIGSFLKRVGYGTTITLNYVDANGSGGTTISDFGLKTIDACVSDIPPLMNYPWAYGTLKYAGFLDLGFVLPVAQLQAPLVPQRADPDANGHFHPAV